MRFHPATMPSSPSDVEYARVADEIYRSLKGTVLENDMPWVDIAEVALRLTAYLEDVVSEGGTWAGLVHISRRLYGRDLPFFPEDDNTGTAEYIVNEVNLDDVRFLLWDSIQQENSQTLINPQTTAITNLAGKIYEIMDARFESMPINPLLRLALAPVEELNVTEDETHRRYEAYLSLRKLLEWLLFDNYAFGDAQIMDDLLDEIEDMTAADDYIDSDKLLYALCVNEVFTHPCRLFSMSTWQVLAAITTASGFGRDIASTIENIAYRPVQKYRVIETDFKKSLMKVIGSDDRPLTIDTWSVKLPDKRTDDHTAITAGLVHVGTDEWYANGIVELSRETNNNDKPNEEAETADFNTLFEKLGGKRHGFFKDLHEYFRSMVSDDVDPELASRREREFIADKDDTSPVLAYLLDDGSVILTTYFVSSLNAPENPYYNHETSNGELLGMLCNPDGEADMINYCISQGWLRNASMTSTLGREHGHRLLQDNIDFIVRRWHNDPYFFTHTPSMT